MGSEMCIRDRLRERLPGTEIDVTLQIYDTMERQKVPFVPRTEGEVAMYVCGPTVYDVPHLGHGRTALTYDMIRRYLEWCDYNVTVASNVTDIDDKIINVANAEGVDFTVVAERNIADYYTVMDAMNVLRADTYPRVTESIPEIIDMVEQLIGKGHAYVANDGVYFEIDSAPEKYGELTGQTLEMVRAGAGGRVDNTGSGKRDHRDFALWKLAKPGEPSWESPWLSLIHI